MFLLDTNVVSELRKAESGKADRNVVAWANGAAPATLFISAITILELEMGVLAIERRDPAQGLLLRRWLDGPVAHAFDQRVLPIDAEVAVRCAHLHIPDRRAERDALIAATALVRGLTLVTRNVADFQGTGVEIINPWLAGCVSVGASVRYKFAPTLGWRVERPQKSPTTQALRPVL